MLHVAVCMLRQLQTVAARVHRLLSGAMLVDVQTPSSFLPSLSRESVCHNADTARLECEHVKFASLLTTSECLRSTDEAHSMAAYAGWGWLEAWLEECSAEEATEAVGQWCAALVSACACWLPPQLARSVRLPRGAGHEKEG